MVTLLMRTESRVDVGNDHNNSGYDGGCNDAVGKTLKRATPMATMVRWPKVFRASPGLSSSGQ